MIPSTIEQAATPDQNHPDRPAPSRRDRIAAPLATAAVIVVGLGYISAVDPNNPGHYPLCPLYAIAHVYCPMCGGLRATHDALHLDFAAAWAMNPLVLILAPLLVIGWIDWFYRSWRGLPQRSIPRWGVWTFIAVLVAYGVARNIPALASWFPPPA